MAIRRESGHASASALRAACDNPFSRQTICRWETYFAASVIVEAREFYAANYAYVEFLSSNPRGLLGDCADLHSGPLFTYELTQAAGDATNVPIHFSSARREGTFSHKAHSCRFTTVFGHLPTLRADADDAMPEVVRRTTWAPLEKVPHSSTGLTQRALYLKQFCHVGGIPWNDIDRHTFSMFNFEDGMGFSYFHVRVFIFASDQGPDQTSCHQTIRTELRGQVFVILITTYCIRHKLSLITHKSLARFETRKTVNKVAMIANTARSGGHSKIRFF